MVAIGDDFWIENDQGQKVFKVDGKALRVRDTLIHEYRVGEGRNKIAEVSKKWFRVRDTYGVEIAENQDDILILAATVAFDMMAHPTR
jgi:uncharacterized protein YxjI